MTTTPYNITTTPHEDGVQAVYDDIHGSLALILSVSDVSVTERCNILNSLNDAVSNNWDELMASFWRGVAGEQLPLIDEWEGDGTLITVDENGVGHHPDD